MAGFCVVREECVEVCGGVFGDVLLLCCCCVVVVLLCCVLSAVSAVFAQRYRQQTNKNKREREEKIQRLSQFRVIGIK